jgi:outer membrane protein assembly factor BamB
MKRIAILLALAVATSGCATIKGWFNDTKKENIQPPTPLVQFTPTLTVQKLWDARPTGGAGSSGAHVAPAYADGK